MDPPIERIALTAILCAVREVPFGLALLSPLLCFQIATIVINRRVTLERHNPPILPVSG